MSLVIEPMPDLGITRVSRWIFNCYVIHDGDDGPVIVDAGLPPHPRRRRTGFERAVRVAVGDRRDTRPQRPRRRGRIAGRTTRCTDLPARRDTGGHRKGALHRRIWRPEMFIAMLGQPDLGDRDVSSLRTGIMAGATCPMEVVKRCINELNMSEVAIAYGVTETSPVSCQTLIDDDLQRRTATVGRVHPHVEIKIIDPDTGTLVKRGEPGEFCTRGYSVMLGYWCDEERTREAVDEEGWMHTGDLAVMRDDGYCAIVGRIKAW